MKDKGKKLLAYLRRHVTGVGIAAVVMAMFFTVARGMSRQGAGFDPGEIASFSSLEWSGAEGRTGYDLSGEGEDSEEIGAESEEEPKEERPEEESPKPEESGFLPKQEESQVILPEGIAEGVTPSGTVGASETIRDSGTKDRYHNTKDENSLPGQEEKPGQSGEKPGQEGTEGEKPGQTEEENPGVTEGEKPSEGEEDTGKFSVMVDGKEHKFDSEDEALIWFAENGGTKEEDGDRKFFEGFIKDESGSLVPSYGNEDSFHFSEGTGTAYDYTGNSSVFVVPNGLTSLELNALSGNGKITTVVVPQSVEEISPGASLPALEKFIVSGANEKFVSVDGVLYQRMEGGLLLRQMPPAKKAVETWPEDLLTVGGYSFQGSKMECLELPNTVTRIEEMAFEDSLVRKILLPESVRSIGNAAFTFRSPEKGEEIPRRSITVKGQIPPAVTNSTFIWMDYALSTGQGGPVTEILVPDSPQDQVYEAYLLTWGSALMAAYGGEASLQILGTGDGAQNRYAYCEEDGKKGYRRAEEAEMFYWKDSTGVYRMDENGGMVLLQCLSTSSMADLSNTEITSIEKGAFDQCSSMTAVRLPESLMTMPEDLFADREGLKVIISYAQVPPCESLQAPPECVVCVRPAALDNYQAAWEGQVRKILGTAELYTATKSGLVFDNSNTRLLDVPPDLSSLSVPSYVTCIYEGAAAGNPALTSITIPAKVTEVGKGAFMDCAGLKTVSWQTSAPVPEACFMGCTGLKTFSASGNGHQLTAIQKRAFYGCTSLGTVLQYSYTSGGGNWIYYYRLEQIGEEAFYGCTSMTYAYFYSSVKDVGVRAFEGSGLISMYWYAAAPVPECCFKNCEGLKIVGWGASLGTGDIPSVGDEAFYGTKSLTELYFPASVTFIGPEAFGKREGCVLTITLFSEEPPQWNRTELPEGLLLYVPDSVDDAVYEKYLDAWKDWLGDAPEQVLKTKDHAEDRMQQQEPETEVLDVPEPEAEVPDPEAEVPKEGDAAESAVPEEDAEDPEEDEAGSDADAEVPKEDAGHPAPEETTDAETLEPEEEITDGLETPDAEALDTKEEEAVLPEAPVAEPAEEETDTENPAESREEQDSNDN